MRRFVSFALVALLVPACAFAQGAPASKTAAAPADATKAKSKSPFGLVIAELTRAAQEKQAAAKVKPDSAGSAAAAPALPPPAHASASATLADSSGG
ncbi:hypothetical protein DWG18_11150 [Lysobacter sp. TY2-98]|uniref:hypothetical protein n=1 Tax=Lysobacter sp. TY2-98 TaxID=2290922 RepID=UPI000E1FFC45|nr:hypothetical protein [Lysobacter sp. TY2-98]AXK72780.1 hypothetical protein DWG18_11150 [Lysobacter sp. TY2-98]